MTDAGRFEEAFQKFQYNPISMTDEDINVLASRESDLEAKAFERRKQAQLDAVGVGASAATNAAIADGRSVAFGKFCTTAMEAAFLDLNESRKIVARAKSALLAAGMSKTAVSTAEPLVTWLSTLTRLSAQQTKEMRELKNEIRRLEQQVKKRVSSVEDRVAAIHQMEFKGDWSPGIYEGGNEVRHHNSIWYAKQTTSAEPGTEHASSRSWVLKSKRPRDARDRGGRDAHHDDD